MTNLQMYIYFQTYPQDWIVHKLSVYILWAFDLLQLIFSILFVYHYTITDFGNPAALLGPVFWSFRLQFVFTIAIVLLVQSFYVLRLWILGEKRRLIPIVVTVGVAGGFVVGILLAVNLYKVQTIVQIPSISWIIYTSFSATTFVDVLIALCFVLYFRSRKSMFSSTNSAISKVLLYIVSTGFLTSTASLTAMIIYALMPHNLIFIAVDLLVSKLYVNSFLAMLNARQHLREKTEQVSFNLGGMSPSLNTQLRSGGGRLYYQESDKVVFNSANPPAINAFDGPSASDLPLSPSKNVAMYQYQGSQAI